MAYIDIAYVRDPSTGVVLFDANGYPQYDNAANANANNYGQILGLGPTFAFPLNDQFDVNTTSSVAAYFQGDYKVTSDLTATLGGRLTHEVKDVEANPNVPGLGYTTAQIQAAKATGEKQSEMRNRTVELTAPNSGRHPPGPTVGAFQPSQTHLTCSAFFTQRLSRRCTR